MTLGEVLVAAATLLAGLAVVGPALGGTSDESSDDLSNVKQLAVPAANYSCDADDRFPMASVWTPRDGYRADARFHGGTEDFDNPFHWAVAIYPYCKSRLLYEAAGAPRHTIAGEPDPKAAVVGYSYNGLLERPQDSGCCLTGLDDAVHAEPRLRQP